MVIAEDGREVACGPALADEADPEMIVPCQLCDDGYRTIPYQEFKASFVAGWDPDAEWIIGRGQLIAWLRDTDPKLAAAAEAYPGRA
jgi:hypothetical protein